MLARWNPKDPEYPNGVIFINQDHPVLVDVVAEWQGEYADQWAEDIRQDVLKVYGEIAVSKVAHSQQMLEVMTEEQVEAQLRSDGALTMALLGLMAEHHVIGTRIGGKYRKQKS